MIHQASSIAGRTTLGRHLIRAAVRTGRVANHLETRILRSRSLAFVPAQYRKVGLHAFKCLLVLAVASFALFIAVVMVAIWTIAMLPISTDRQPRIHEMSHPRHHLLYPEMYDDNGTPR